MSEKRKSSKPNASRVTYLRDDDGKWTKKICASQCPFEDVFGWKCQGCKGHSGDHWAYDAKGFYLWHKNSREETSRSKYRIVSGTTPPGHPSYISPEQRQQDIYFRHSTFEPVTSKRLIKKLEDGEYPDLACVIRPVQDERLPQSVKKRLQARRRMAAKEDAANE